VTIGRKEFEELQNIAQRLDALRIECEKLKDEARTAKAKYDVHLSRWAIDWLEKVERTCENAGLDLFQTVNRSIPFLMTASLPWRKGGAEDKAVCACCGKPVNRILTIRAWKER